MNMNNLAIMWKSQGRNEEAIVLMKECVELRKKVLGPSHPDTEQSLEALRLFGVREDEVGHSD